MHRLYITKIRRQESSLPAVLSVTVDYTGNRQCWLQAAYLQSENGGPRLVFITVPNMKAESEPEQPHLAGQTAVEVISTGIR